MGSGLFCRIVSTAALVFASSICWIFLKPSLLSTCEMAPPRSMMGPTWFTAGQMSCTQPHSLGLFSAVMFDGFFSLVLVERKLKPLIICFIIVIPQCRLADARLHSDSELQCLPVAGKSQSRDKMLKSVMLPGHSRTPAKGN